MTEYRSIRIRMKDRPGALSAIGAALAAQRVDIVRLDVVSHEDGSVVDDLFLAGEDRTSIERATSSFHSDVEVQMLSALAGDPVAGMGAALGGVAAAPGARDALAAVARGVPLFLPCDSVAVLQGGEDGNYTVVEGPAGLTGIGSSAPFAFRRLRAPVEQDGKGSWAPEEITAGFAMNRVAATPFGPAGVLLVGRAEPLRFYGGELARLGTYAVAAASIAEGKATPARLAAAT
jgi:ACT domain